VAAKKDTKPRQGTDALPNELLHIIFNNLIDGLITIDTTGTIKTFNPAAETIFGYSTDEIRGKNISLLMPSPHRERHDDYLAEYCRTGQGRLIGHGPREVMGQHKDGHCVPIELAISKAHIEDEMVFIGAVRDISQRKQVEVALQQSEERFNLAMLGSNDGLWDWNLLSNEVYFSPRWKQMLGYEQDELPNELESWSENVYPDDLPLAMQAIDDYLCGNTPEFRIEFRMYHKNGTDVDILSRGSVVRDSDRTPLRFVGTHVDMTQQKQTQSLLRESEHKFRTIFDSADDAMMLLDENGFFDCNQSTLKIFGCDTRDEFCRMHPANFSPPTQTDGRDSLEKANQTIATTMKQGKNFFEWTHRRSNGQDFPAEVLLTAMQLDGRPILHATVRDITARKQAEQTLKQQHSELQQANKNLNETQAQLLQSEKMASIGQLAAGVAHEINNPVGYVSSNITALKTYTAELLQLLDSYQALETELPQSDAKQALLALKDRLELEFLRQDMDDIISESLEGVSRVKQIVQDLKDFSHINEATWQLSNLHKGLDSTLNIVHSELKYKAEIVKEYAELPPIHCLPSQLNQVFMNLFVNAGHAIDTEGKIYIRTGLDDNQVWVEVEDNGCGIAPEHIKRIFDPFFTTKDVGKGTGLGLSLTYGIIEKHNGRIEVDSETGRGTRFRIWLPRQQTVAEE